MANDYEKRVMLEMIDAKIARWDWSKVPFSIQRDSVKLTNQNMTKRVGGWPKSAIKARIAASKATTFTELREAVEKM